jgi:uncharacterized protein (DUF4415 family)
MAKKGPIVRYTAEELADKRRHGENRSDWARAAAMTSQEIEAQVAADPDEAGMVVDWKHVTVELPKPKADLHMRVDRDVLDYFRSGQGLSDPHQCRSAILRRADAAGLVDCGFHQDRLRHGEGAKPA